MAARQELAAVAAGEVARYREAAEAGDAENTAVWFGEAAGLIHGIVPAAQVVRAVLQGAAEALRRDR